MKKILIGCGAFAALMVMLLIAFVVVVGAAGPETFVVTGNQLKKRHHKVVQELKLIETGEKIRYFYSDAMVDVRKGMYFVTDQKLVLYNNTWPEPLLATPLSEIESIEADYSDSWLEDSYVYVLLDSGEEWSFPVSSEKGMDHKFVEHIQSKMAAAESSSPVTTPRDRLLPEDN